MLGDNTHSEWPIKQSSIHIITFVNFCLSLGQLVQSVVCAFSDMCSLVQEVMGFCLRPDGFSIMVFFQIQILQLEQLVTDRQLDIFLIHSFCSISIYCIYLQTLIVFLFCLTLSCDTVISINLHFPPSNYITPLWQVVKCDCTTLVILRYSLISYDEKLFDEPVRFMKSFRERRGRKKERDKCHFYFLAPKETKLSKIMGSIGFFSN